MEPAPIVMVMGQGKETQGGKEHRDTSTSAVCVEMMGMRDYDGYDWDILVFLVVVMSLNMLREINP